LLCLHDCIPALFSNFFQSVECFAVVAHLFGLFGMSEL
jgi:hypothetical protein